MMIGTEQTMVTRMVNTMLSNKVTGASHRLMINVFKGLAINSALNRTRWLILSENDVNDGSALPGKSQSIYPQFVFP
ncbi:hypothetical protein E2R62_16195 [Citrobacter rodentium]|uniref:Uncharacterized protein n=1 Tax=Citrobacter rodentium TaxID=67825 RepID=A0A482PJG8_CITRO|nr:hypothetical protein E2R62_16195 [Citrobacter rodentium]